MEDAIFKMQLHNSCRTATMFQVALANAPRLCCLKVRKAAFAMPKQARVMRVLRSAVAKVIAASVMAMEALVTAALRH
jgi:hypothetical protein